MRNFQAHDRKGHRQTLRIEIREREKRVKKEEGTTMDREKSFAEKKVLAKTKKVSRDQQIWHWGC